MSKTFEIPRGFILKKALIAPFIQVHGNHELAERVKKYQFSKQGQIFEALSFEELYDFSPFIKL